MKDAAQGVAEDVPQDVAQDLALGARAARALLASFATTVAAAVFEQHALRWGRNWAAQWHWYGLWVSASGGAAQIASMLILSSSAHRPATMRYHASAPSSKIKNRTRRPHHTHRAEARPQLQPRACRKTLGSEHGQNRAFICLMHCR